MSRHNKQVIFKKGAVTLSSVEGSSVEACPPCFDGAQHDTLFTHGVNVSLFFSLDS
ncbi:hypothetical protein SAMN05428975_5387 [Mucilaginibacter sp. OK268]|nr:hypothetical protein SAMN05428975_5387 [Mucilaginibacter sp. OK268]